MPHYEEHNKHTFIYIDLFYYNKEVDEGESVSGYYIFTFTLTRQEASEHNAIQH